MSARPFFHYQNEKYDVLLPTRGRYRHSGEAPNAVGQDVVYLFDRRMPDLRRGDDFLSYEHEVQIDANDPLLEQEDPTWMPHTWIYRGSLDVLVVMKYDAASSTHSIPVSGAGGLASPRAQIQEVAYDMSRARNACNGTASQDWFLAKGTLRFQPDQ